MFEHLGGFERVLVTGPQRSGTRICAKMIAHDTDLRFVDEREFCVDSLNRLWKLLQDETGIVVQCPALCRYVHHLASNDDAVVFMLRPSADIQASQDRIGWEWEPPELMRYDANDEAAAVVKLDYWFFEQREQITSNFGVVFNKLEKHPLWIPKEQRANFEAYQTE
jgi:hypothetical protein